MFMQLLALVQQAVMYSTLQKYGGEEQAILMGGFFRYLMLTFIPLWGLSQGFQPFVGTNFGAGLFDRVKKGTFAFYLFGVLIALIGWVCFLISPEGILSLFINDVAMIAKGKMDAIIAYIIFPIVPVLILNITLFQALGKAKAAGLIAIDRQFLLFVPLCILLPIWFGSRGVWLSMPIVDGIMFLLSILLVIGVFKKDLKRKVN